MDTKFKRTAIATFLWLLLGLIVVSPLSAKGKKPHPFDKFNHEMHTSFFESIPVPCDTCHADPASFADHSKINPLGCHKCHNSPNPILPATNDCKLCHEGGFPRPKSHRTGWREKHQIYAKQDPNYCTQCHTNAMFCIDCHQRRDTVQEKMHRRNFRFFHSIEARANPRRCEACHTVVFCQECHSGRGTSKR